MKKGEIWWADLGPYRPKEQLGRRPVVVWQSNALNRVLQSVLVVPTTTNLERANLAGTAVIESLEDGPPETSIALAFQMRAVPRSCLKKRVRMLTALEAAELEVATDEALGRMDPELR